MTSLDLLSTFRITGTYRTKIRNALECMFVETHGAVNPPIQQNCRGFIINLPDGTKSEVPSDFEVTVYEVDGFKEVCAK